MLGQTRTNAKLLRQVKGKQHATADDHNDPSPIQPATNSTGSSGSQIKPTFDEEDFDRDPESSEDELPTLKLPMGGGQMGGNRPNPPAIFQKPTTCVEDSNPKASAQFRLPRSNTPSVSGSNKRISPPSSPYSQEDAIIFSSQSSQPKRLKIPPASNQNIHVPPPKGAILKKILYQSKRTSAKTSRPQKKAKMPTVKTAHQLAHESVQGKGAIFQKARGADLKFDELPHDPSEFRSSSPISAFGSLPSSPGVEEVQGFRLPTAIPYVATIECNFCGKSLPRTLLQDFEDKFTGGQPLNYKWRGRFCTYHNERQAETIWRERGYPDIEWNRLGDRLQARKHVQHIKCILDGDVHSMYREELKETLNGRSKTLAQLEARGDKKQSRVGYYGPRGEKVMTEYIVSRFGDQLRSAATTDKLVVAAGVSGGISGFIHAVLVPELAVSLIMEDFKTNSMSKVADIIAESAELGELVNPESEDKVGDIAVIDD
ncbi:Hypothetical protein R9X50_00443900 [Acrodontium crateriforme]|uniref:Restriction of telomere capping protein 4 n=1 Tax=Acrodontium crateriforme TaxID=150365 RepID=A0AAQ3RA69_9PEZI|nr:Hypothetical protein R9X50_00443900 [Acrodontium crateriforme]